jgi:hypothetical protein
MSLTARVLKNEHANQSILKPGGRMNSQQQKGSPWHDPARKLELRQGAPKMKNQNLANQVAAPRPGK